MKKILLTSLLSVSSILALASCGNNDTNKTESTTPTESATQGSTSGEGYEVTVKYENGTGLEGVRVQFCDAESCYAQMVETDKNGVAFQNDSFILSLTSDLIVHINKGLPSGYTYNMNGTKVNKENPTATLTLYQLASTDHVVGTKEKPATVSTGYYKTCLAKGAVTYMNFTPSESGTYEIETYDDILSRSDTYMSISTNGNNVTKDDNSGEGKNAKCSIEATADTTYTIAILQNQTPTEEDFTFSILKK